MEQQKVEVMIVAENDRYIPKYAHEDDIGLDLIAKIDPGVHIFIPPEGSCLIPTGIRIMLPKGYEGQVRSRSGMALKNQVFVLNSPGTIDPGYSGEVGVNLYNAGRNNFQVMDGMRIAQLVVMPVPKVRWNIVDELPTTERGEAGYGSTGK